MAVARKLGEETMSFYSVVRGCMRPTLASREETYLDWSRGFHVIFGHHWFLIGLLAAHVPIPCGPVVERSSLFESSSAVVRWWF